MLKLSVILSVLCSISCLHLQGQDIDSEIRTLENREVHAVLLKDSATLLKLWDKNYTVNSPDNVIYSAGSTTLDRPVLKRSRTSFNRVSGKSKSTLTNYSRHLATSCTALQSAPQAHF